MNFPNYKFALVVISIVFTAHSVRTWDLAVVATSQLHFFMNKTVETSAAHQLTAMVALAYDPVKKDVYISDSNHKDGSIFRMKTTGEDAYTSVEPIVIKQRYDVQGMAFDHRKSVLYWTTGYGLTINYLHITDNATHYPVKGNVLLNFNSSTVPMGIAIDTCRGYLYWTNAKQSNAAIERSRLDGSEHKVLINGSLSQPIGIAIDLDNDLLYWTNERGTMFYSIESSNLDGTSRRTLIHGTHHQPFSIAVGDKEVYWSDWINKIVWALPKDSFQGGVEPKEVYKYKYLAVPNGLITPTPTHINDTKCIEAKRDDTLLMTETTVQETASYEVLRNMCKNNGILHANGTCTCAPEFEGKSCETHLCDGYCVSGTCSVDQNGRPRCQCSADATGERCELQTCSDGCQNGGSCLLDKDGRKRCSCPHDYTGDMCQIKSSDLISELCSAYCRGNQMMNLASTVCSCEQYVSEHHYDYSNMERCKLNKTPMFVMGFLLVIAACLGTTTLVLARRVRFLGRRPRIKKRIVVNKSITPLQSCRPPQQQNQQCEITIENCCNMNICETPCFEPDYRPPKLGGLLQSLGKSKKEDKTNLLSNTDMSSEDEKPSY